MQTNYSWLPKVSTSPIVNAKWIGRTNLIFGWWGNSRWITIIQNEMEQQKIFKYSNILDIFEEVYSELAQIWHPTLLSDLKQRCDSFNRASKEASKIIGIELNSVPSYSPNLAPVEMVFGVLKRKIWCMKAKKIDFSKPNGRRTLANVLKKLHNDTWKRMWLNLIWEAKKTLIEML